MNVRTLFTTTATLLALAATSWAASEREIVSKLDTNSDGVLTLKEVQADYPEITAEEFAKVDTNADGAVDEEEIRAAQKAGLLPESKG